MIQKGLRALEDESVLAPQKRDITGTTMVVIPRDCQKRNAASLVFVSG